MDTIFETPRLRVRPWRESDAEALFRYASEPEVDEWAGWPPHTSIEESIKVIREVFSNGHTFAMELKETGEAIGCIGYYDHAESNIQIGEGEGRLVFQQAAYGIVRGTMTDNRTRIRRMYLSIRRIFAIFIVQSSYCKQ